MSQKSTFPLWGKVRLGNVILCCGHSFSSVPGVWVDVSEPVPLKFTKGLLEGLIDICSLLH